MNYEQAKELLTSQGKFYINLGLERIQSILKLIGNPQEKIKIIHVAGTNGKGSVSSILANILKCAGYKTGLYTSPHLVEYTERIKINNIDISKKDFAWLILVGDISMPVTSHPHSRNGSRLPPSPHPISRTLVPRPMEVSLSRNGI